jgi:hypothetical protein
LNPFVDVFQTSGRDGLDADQRATDVGPPHASRPHLGRMCRGN